MATKDCESADVRDRAYIYWRLLSTDPGAAKVRLVLGRGCQLIVPDSQAVVLASKPPITLSRTTVPSAVLEELLGEIGSLASVYQKPAETFIGRGRVGADALKRNVEYVQNPRYGHLTYCSSSIMPLVWKMKWLAERRRLKPWWRVNKLKICWTSMSLTVILPMLH